MLDFEQRPVARPAQVELPPGVSLRLVGDADGEAVTRLLSEFGAPRTPPPERMEAVLRTFDEHLRRVATGEARTTVAVRNGHGGRCLQPGVARPVLDDRDARLAARPDR